MHTSQGIDKCKPSDTHYEPIPSPKISVIQNARVSQTLQLSWATNKHDPILRESGGVAVTKKRPTATHRDIRYNVHSLANHGHAVETLRVSVVKAFSKYHKTLVT